jgi:hypothetical protein
MTDLKTIVTMERWNTQMMRRLGIRQNFYRNRLFIALQTLNYCAMSRNSDIISCIEPLGFPFKTKDPFLFCVYHKDFYPAGDAQMRAPRKGNGIILFDFVLVFINGVCVGADFNPNSPYRMYHGDRIPGFPQHPHRGFETVTATMEGLIDHTDSCGNGGRYGHGDLQWMTAGSGVVHGEMFPLINNNSSNTLRLFQIWLNLPAKDKMVPPSFKMVI